MDGYTPVEQDIRARNAAKASGPAGGLLADSDGEHLASIITQLADAQAFLTANPVPVSKFAPANIWKFCDSTAEVDQIAAAIGEEASWNDGGRHYETSRAFGNEVRYRALYILKHEPGTQDPAAGEDEDDSTGAGQPAAA